MTTGTGGFFDMVRQRSAGAKMVCLLVFLQWFVSVHLQQRAKSFSRLDTSKVLENYEILEKS